MLCIHPTDAQMRRARKIVNSMPLLRSSITNNKMTLHGIIAEIIYLDCGLLPADAVSEQRRPQLFNHDIICPDGFSFEVKTRVLNKRNLPPPRHYGVHVSQHSHDTQNPNIWLFAMVDKDISCVYLLGAMANRDKLTLPGREAKKRGDYPGNWRVRRDVVTYPISSLHPITKLSSLIANEQSLSSKSQYRESPQEGQSIRRTIAAKAIYA